MIGHDPIDAQVNDSVLVIVTTVYRFIQKCVFMGNTGCTRPGNEAYVLPIGIRSLQSVNKESVIPAFTQRFP